MDPIEQACADMAAAFAGEMTKAFADDAALDLAYSGSTTSATKAIHDWTWKKLAGIKLLESTLAQQKLARRARLNERLVRVQQDVYAKKMEVTPTDSTAAEDSEKIQVGDNEIHYHYESGQPASTPASPTVPAAEAETPSGFTWPKAALLAAALLAGTGLGAGIPSSSSSTTTTTNPSNDQGLGIEVVPGGAIQQP
jgi:hypothetical protein